MILNLKWHSRNNNWLYFDRLSFGREDDKWMESYQTTHTRAPYILEKKDQLILPSGPSKGSLPVQTPYILGEKNRQILSNDGYCSSPT